MKYYELTATAYLKEDILFDHAGEAIGSVINRTMLCDEKMKNLHEDKIFKHYCFGSFYPLEKEKIYKKGSVYTFKVRTLNKDFSDCIRKNLKSIQCSTMAILAIEELQRNQIYISHVYSVTPVIITVDENKRWTKEQDFMLLNEKIVANLEKKYKAFYGDSLESKNSINRIEVMNKKPMTVKYKNIKLLGNKFKIWFNEDTNSQKLAFIAMSCGLGEKNASAGTGFCMGGQDG